MMSFLLVKKIPNTLQHFFFFLNVCFLKSLREIGLQNRIKKEKEN